MKKYQNYLKPFLLSTLCSAVLFGLTACHTKQNSSAADKRTIITIKQQAQTLHLYYKGKIAPIKVYSVLSPVSGHISKMGFAYGDPIKENQLIVTISADTLADDYQKQLSDYISKKDAMEMAENDYTTTMSLFKAGVKNQYDVSTARSTYNNSILALNTSKHTLAKTAALLGIDMKTVEALTLRDVTQVTKEMNKKFKNIKVFAHHNGVALHPLATQNNSSSNNSNSNDSNNQIAVGSDIKQKQLLLSIGDLHGYSTHFNVSEVDIHNFKIGQKVFVTGPAFPHITLQGVVTSVASQANSSDSSSGSLAQFSVVAKIPKVTQQAMQKIDIGMSAKIDVPITTKPSISVPINALYAKHGQTFVNILNAQGQSVARPVRVGNTLVSSAIISSGLKSGDKVVVPND